MKEKTILDQIEVTTSIATSCSVSAKPNTSSVGEKSGDEDELPPEVIHWVTFERGFFLALILSWGKEFRVEDANDILQQFTLRLQVKGCVKVIGQITKGNFIYHLRREKENWRRREFAKKRGGAVMHQSLDELHDFPFSPDQQGTSSGWMEASLLKDELIELQRHLRLIKVEARGHLLILVDVLDRIFICYQGPKDVLEAMTDAEKEAFLPAGVSLNDMGAMEKILKQISRTMTELRKRLRGLKHSIEFN